MTQFNTDTIEQWLAQLAAEEPISIPPPDDSDIVWGYTFRLANANNILTAPLLMVSYHSGDQLNCGFVLRLGDDTYSLVEVLPELKRQTLWFDIVDLICKYDVDFRLEGPEDDLPISLGENIPCPKYILIRRGFFEMPTLTTFGDTLQQLQNLFYRLRVLFYRVPEMNKP